MSNDIVNCTSAPVYDRESVLVKLIVVPATLEQAY